MNSIRQMIYTQIGYNEIRHYFSGEWKKSKHDNNPLQQHLQAWRSLTKSMLTSKTRHILTKTNDSAIVPRTDLIV